MAYCASCDEPCEAVEERIDYSGTHCTGGRAGTHYTGYYYSDCCNGELIDDEERHNDALQS